MRTVADRDALDATALQREAAEQARIDAYLLLAAMLRGAPAAQLLESLAPRAQFLLRREQSRWREHHVCLPPRHAVHELKQAQPEQRAGGAGHRDHQPFRCLGFALCARASVHASAVARCERSFTKPGLL